MEKILKPGVALELLSRKYEMNDEEAAEHKMASSIYDVLDKGHIQITNPVIKARMIPLHAGERYNAYFHASKIYTAPVSVVRSRSDGNFRIVEMELTGSLQKYERRAFFRLEVSLPVRYLVLTADNAKEFQAAVKSGTLLQMPGFQNGKTLDISGGGIRFTSSQEIPINAMVITHMIADMAGEKKHYIFLGKLLRESLLNGQRGCYDHRMQFVDMKQDAREEFVRFIFECERERIKKMNGLQ